MDPEEIKKLMEGMQQTFADFKTANDEQITALKEDNLSGKNGEAIKAMNDKLDAAEAKIEKVKAIEEKQAKLESLLSAIPGNAKGDKDELTAEKAEYKELYLKYLRTEEKLFGQEDFLRLKELEAKTMSVQSDPDGGFTVDTVLSSRIIEKQFETSPMRNLANIETIKGDEYTFLIDKDEAGTGWVGETQARPETTTPQIQKGRIVVHEQYASPATTQKLLNDSAWDVAKWLSNKVVNKMSRTENTGFITGDAIGKPQGLLTLDAGSAWGQVEQISSGAAAAFTADGILDLVYSLKSVYANNASFLANRLAIRDIRKLKDGDGRYIFEYNSATRVPQLLGQAITAMSDMPVVAADSLSLAYGNWQEAYTIVDGVSFRVLRDPYTNKPYVIFYTTKFVGGGVENSEAYKIQKIEA